jgi:dihydrofolate reductase
MRNVILDLAVTLDGFIEGPNGEIDWCVMDDDMDFEGFISGIDTIFYGRVSYEMWGNYKPGENANQAEKSLWAAIHSKQKFVFSRTAQEDENATWITSDIIETVAEIKAQEGTNIWLYGGAKLISGFVNLGLIDQYRLSVHPTALGKGKYLFENLNYRLNLSLLELKPFKSGVVQLIYSTETTDR